MPIVVIIGNEVVMMDNVRLKYIDLMAMCFNMRGKIKGILLYCSCVYGQAIYLISS